MAIKGECAFFTNTHRGKGPFRGAPVLWLGGWYTMTRSHSSDAPLNKSARGAALLEKFDVPSAHDLIGCWPAGPPAVPSPGRIAPSRRLAAAPSAEPRGSRATPQAARHKPPLCRSLPGAWCHAGSGAQNQHGPRSIGRISGSLETCLALGRLGHSNVTLGHSCHSAPAPALKHHPRSLAPSLARGPSFPPACCNHPENCVAPSFSLGRRGRLPPWGAAGHAAGRASELLSF